MPLILISGLPSSGKSTRVKALQQQLISKIASLPASEPGTNLKVIVHSDESLGISKEEYRESRTEKSLRGLQISAVKRDLSRNNIVILDSPAYIKGSDTSYTVRLNHWARHAVLFMSWHLLRLVFNGTLRDHRRINGILSCWPS
jgi:tRNA uridine 5-carbamoylmethylation protein Kti12